MLEKYIKAIVGGALYVIISTLRLCRQENQSHLISRCQWVMFMMQLEMIHDHYCGYDCLMTKGALSNSYDLLSNAYFTFCIKFGALFVCWMIMNKRVVSSNLQVPSNTYATYVMVQHNYCSTQPLHYMSCDYILFININNI